jgi:hypothetical protein
MTPLEQAETLEARAAFLGDVRIPIEQRLNVVEIERTVLALRGAADTLRLVHRHDLERLQQ